MIVVYNKPFLDDISRQDNMVEILGYSIINKLQASKKSTSSTPNPYDLISLLDAVISELDKNSYTSVEGIWDSETKNLKLNIEFTNYEVSSGCDGLVIYYRLIGVDSSSKIAFTLIGSDTVDYDVQDGIGITGDEWTTVSYIETDLGLCQTKNLITVNFPETTLSNVICTQSEDTEFLESYGIEIGENLYRISDGGKADQVVSRESYYKYLREHNSTLPDQTAIKWLDENGMFGQTTYTFRCYTLLEYQIPGLASDGYPVPTLRGLSWEGGFIQIYGYANYIDYEVSSTGEVTEVNSGRESISSIPGVDLVQKSTQDGYSSTVNNLTKIITYNKLSKEPDNTISPAGIYEIELKYYNPISKEKESLTSGEFRLLQAETEGGWYISNSNTSYKETYDNLEVPLYLLDYTQGASTSFQISTSLSENDLIDSVTKESNVKVITTPIDGTTKPFTDTFTVTTNTTISSTSNSIINVTIKTNSENDSTSIWAPKSTGTADDEFDYACETWWLYRVGQALIGINPNADSSTLVTDLGELRKALSAKINIDQASTTPGTEDVNTWNSYITNTTPRSELKNCFDRTDWIMYNSPETVILGLYYLSETETTEQITTRVNNMNSTLKNLDMIVSYLKTGTTSFASLESGTETLKPFEYWYPVKKGYGMFGWNNTRNDSIDTDTYDKLIIKFSAALEQTITLGIGAGDCTTDKGFSGKEYTLGKGEKEFTLDISGDTDILKNIKTIYFKTPECDNSSCSVSLNSFYFYHKTLLTTKQKEISLSDIENIYNTKYSTLSYKSGIVSYKLDMTGTTTKLKTVENPGTYNSRLFITEVSCGGYKSYFYAVQKCKAFSIYPVSYSTWYYSSSYINGSSNYSSTFSRTQTTDTDLVFISGDRDDAFDLASEDDYNHWTVLSVPEGITITDSVTGKSYGELRHNPKDGSDTSTSTITVTIPEEISYIGTKTYPTVVIARIKKSSAGKDITTDWRAVVSMGTCYLTFTKQGQVPQLSVSTENLGVSNIGVYSFVVYSNCNFYVDISGVKGAQDSDNSGTVFDRNAFGRYGDSVTSNSTLFYYSSYDLSYGEQVYLCLKRIPGSYESDNSSSNQDWGKIVVYPDYDADESNTCNVSVVGSPYVDHMGYKHLGYYLSSYGMVSETSSASHYVVLGDKNSWVDLYGIDTYHPYAKATFPSGSHLTALGNTSAGDVTKMQPYFSGYKYNYHVSRYTQYSYGDVSGYATEETYPLQAARLCYTMYCVYGGDREIFYVYGKGKPLMINNLKSGNTYLYLTGDTSGSKDISFNYPVTNTDYYSVSYTVSSSAKFSYTRQQKSSTSTYYDETINFSVTEEGASYSGYIGSLTINFKLTSSGLVYGKSFTDTELNRYVTPASYTIYIYHTNNGGDSGGGEDEPTERYFSNFFNGCNVPFIGQTLTTYPVWLSEDNNADNKYCTLDPDYSLNTDNYSSAGNFSNYLRIIIPSRYITNSFDIADYSRYGTYYGTQYIRGNAQMITVTSGVSTVVYSETFSVTQTGYYGGIIYKSSTKTPTIYFTTSSDNTYTEKITYSTTQFECILTGVKLKSTGQVNPNDVEQVSITNNNGSGVSYTINSSTDLTGWETNNCTITLPKNDTSEKKTYKFSVSYAGNSFMLVIEQNGNSGTVVITDSGVSSSNLPFLSYGSYFGNTAEIGVLRFRTDIPQSELVVKIDSDQILPGNIKYLDKIDDEFNLFKIDNLIISANQSDQLVTRKLSFIRSVQGVESTSLDCTIHQGYYCFYLDNTTNGGLIGTTSNPVTIPSYGQNNTIPWSERKKFSNRLVQREVNPTTGELGELIDNLQGSFTLTSTGLQSVSLNSWYKLSGGNALNSISELSSHNTEIVWGESTSKGITEQEAAFPFLENTYTVNSAYKTELYLRIDATINVKYPSKETTTVEKFLSQQSLNYQYVMYLYKPALPDVVFSLDKNDITIDAEGGNDTVKLSIDNSTIGDIKEENIGFDVTNDNTWLTISSTDNRTFSITVNKNTGDSREGQVTFKMSTPIAGTSKNIIIHQNGAS